MIHRKNSYDIGWWDIIYSDGMEKRIKKALYGFINPMDLLWVQCVQKSTHHFNLVNWWLDSDPIEVFAYTDLEILVPRVCETAVQPQADTSVNRNPASVLEVVPFSEWVFKKLSSNTVYSSELKSLNRPFN